MISARGGKIRSRCYLTPPVFLPVDFYKDLTMLFLPKDILRVIDSHLSLPQKVKMMNICKFWPRLVKCKDTSFVKKTNIYYSNPRPLNFQCKFIFEFPNSISQKWMYRVSFLSSSKYQECFAIVYSNKIALWHIPYKTIKWRSLAGLLCKRFGFRTYDWNKSSDVKAHIVIEHFGDKLMFDFYIGQNLISWSL